MRISKWFSMWLLMLFVPGLHAGIVVDASAASLVHQGPNVEGSNAHVQNGVLLPGENYAGNGGSTDAGPLGSGVTSAFASVTQNGSNGATALFGSAFASVDLNAGALHAIAAGNGVNNFGSPRDLASASFRETITFNNISAAAVLLDISWLVEGAVTNPAAGGIFIQSGLNLSEKNTSPGQIGIVGRTGPLADSIRFNDVNGSIYYDSDIAGVWTKSTVAAPVGGLMQAALIIPTGLSIMDINGYLNLDCGGGSTCDFGNTAAFAFGPEPAGLSWSSESGVFLSDQVPEPATQLLFAGSLIAVALIRRRKEA